MLNLHPASNFSTNSFSAEILEGELSGGFSLFGIEPDGIFQGGIGIEPDGIFQGGIHVNNILCMNHVTLYIILYHLISYYALLYITC